MLVGITFWMPLAMFQRRFQSIHFWKQDMQNVSLQQSIKEQARAGLHQSTTQLFPYTFRR